MLYTRKSWIFTTDGQPLNDYKCPVRIIEFLFMLLILGVTLPKIMRLHTEVLKSQGTSVKVGWPEPVDSRKAAWKYGLYYGVNAKELLGQGTRMCFVLNFK